MNRLVKMLMLVTILVCGSAGLAFGQEASSPEKLADIRHLMKLTGSADIGEQVIDQMIRAMQASVQGVPAEFWEEVRSGMDPNALVDLNVPIYDKYLTHKEIKAIIGFYESPVGAKFLSVLPNIAQESYMAGAKWGNTVAQGVGEKLVEQGYMDASELEGAPQQ